MKVDVVESKADKVVVLGTPLDAVSEKLAHEETAAITPPSSVTQSESTVVSTAPHSGSADETSASSPSTPSEAAEASSSKKVTGENDAQPSPRGVDSIVGGSPVAETTNTGAATMQLYARPAASVANGNGAAGLSVSSSLLSDDSNAQPAASLALSPAERKFYEGKRLASVGKLDEAELILREAVRLDASKPDYLVSLANVLLKNPRYDRSGTLPVVRSLLDRVVQIAPDDAEAAALHRSIIRDIESLNDDKR